MAAPPPRLRPAPESPLFSVKNVETVFEAWARWVLRFRWLVIAAVVIGSALLAAQLPNIRMDNSTQSFLKPEDPALLFYNDFQDRFGNDELIVLGVSPPKVFDFAFLSWLRDLHRILEEEVPHIEEVQSLVNARSTRGEGDQLIVEDFLGDWPESPEELAVLEARALASPLYRNFLLSDDARFTVITLRRDTYADGAADDLDAILAFSGDDAEGDRVDPPGGRRPYLDDISNRELVNAIERVVEEHASPLYPIHVAGTPLLVEHMNGNLQRDIARLLGLSSLITCVMLFVLFRRSSGVLLPLAVVVLSLTSTLGIMVLIDLPLSVITQIIPPFIITVGVCDAVHILTIVYQRLAAGDERHDAIVHALGHSGLAVMMTSVTTAAGMLSFTTAALAPISYLGILAPIGVMLAFFYTVTLLPALLAVLPLRARAGGRGAAAFPRFDAMLQTFAKLSYERPWTVVGVSAVLLGVAGYGAAQLRFSHDSLLWFPEHDPFRQATILLDEELRGTTTLEVLVETGRENGLHEPDLLRRINAMGKEAEAFERGDIYVGKAISLVDVVKETHRALNQNQDEFYAIPGDRRLVAQELLLFENSGADDLEDFSDSLFQTGRMTLKIPWHDAIQYTPVMAALQARFQEILGDTARVELTGLVALLSRTFEAVVISLGRSYVFAISIITPLMMLLLGSVRRGLLAMIPNLTPVVLVLGFMGWAGIPLDIATLTIGSIILGLAVDDTIHFMHKFRRYSEESGEDAGHAIRETLRTTGRAMLFTTLILAAGFVVFYSAYMVTMKSFGILTGTAVVAAFFADVLLAPALMTLWDRRVRAQA